MINFVLLIEREVTIGALGVISVGCAISSCGGVGVGSFCISALYRFW